VTDAGSSRTELAFDMFWGREVVPLEAIERALYSLADLVTGTVLADGDQWRVTLYPRGATTDSNALAPKLRQEVIDQTLRVRIAARTDPIRNVIFALAFSRSGLVEPHADR
jgi:His-Xaa-Ser system protein HxsD